MVETKRKGKTVGESPSALTREERVRCIGDLCVSDDGSEIEVHLDGTNPQCDRFTQLLGPKVIMGLPTRYIVDPPEKGSREPREAPPARRKG